MTVHEQAKMKHNHCCVNNMPRGFMNMVQLAACRTEKGISVHFYTDFEAEAEDFRLQVSGDYLSSGKVVLKCEAAHPMNLRMRIPGWAVSAELEWNGQNQTGKGDWFEIELPAGKSEVRLAFGRKLEILEHPAQKETNEWYFSRWNDSGMEDLFREERGSTLVYGPLLLARSKWIGNTEGEMFGHPIPQGFSCKLTPVSSDAARCVYEADFGSFKTRVCDYASAGNADLEDTRFFSIFF